MGKKKRIYMKIPEEEHQELHKRKISHTHFKGKGVRLTKKGMVRVKAVEG